MPRGDGKGPMGRGTVGSGNAGRGGRIGRMGGGMVAGPGGVCVCPSCGEKVPHQVGTPCTSLSCPKCGGEMVRGQ